jgi:hypothetical protein
MNIFLIFLQCVLLHLVLYIRKNLLFKFIVELMNLNYIYYDLDSSMNLKNKLFLYIGLERVFD